VFSSVFCLHIVAEFVIGSGFCCPNRIVPKLKLAPATDLVLKFEMGFCRAEIFDLFATFCLCSVVYLS